MERALILSNCPVVDMADRIAEALTGAETVAETSAARRRACQRRRRAQRA